MQCNCTTKTYSTLYLNYSAYYTCNYYTKLQMLLHKITDCVRNNNTKLQIKWHAHSTHKISRLHTKLIHWCSYVYLHMKLTWCVLETFILSVALTYSLWSTIMIWYHMNITRLIINLSSMKYAIGDQGSDGVIKR